MLCSAFSTQTSWFTGNLDFDLQLLTILKRSALGLAKVPSTLRTLKKKMCVTSWSYSGGIEDIQWTYSGVIVE